MSDRTGSKRTRAKPTPRGDVTDEVDLALVKIVETEPALTNLEIGERLHMDQETVAKRRSRPAFRRLYQDRNLPAREVITAYKGLAARVYASMLAGGTPPAVRERVAARILGLDLEPAPVENAQGPVGLLLPPDAVDAIRRYYSPGGGAPVSRRRRRRAA